MSSPRRLRAPREDHAVLALPPLSEAGQLLAGNRQQFKLVACSIFGRQLEDLRNFGRSATLDAARVYLAGAGEPVPPLHESSLILAGHQPELFHPGVWIKNFALNALARAHQASPVNLVVDNDDVKTTGLRVPAVAGPGGEIHDPRSEKFQPSPAPSALHPALVPFDRWQGEVPYEERKVLDGNLFQTFAGRVLPLTQTWGFVPFLDEFWKEMQRQSERTPLLGERFAAARRTFERAWGCHNLEVPVSSLCRTEPFAWFVCHLLANLQQFHAAYNSCLHEYRKLHGLRSRSHPVPDLAAENGWLELPFWTWRTDNPRRARLFARVQQGLVSLRIGNQPGPVIPGADASRIHQSIAAWQDLERNDLKVRSRVLTNTLFARVFLGDLFIHGIGGGIYDEITDGIIRRFYGFEPPGYLILSGTLLLPLSRVPVPAFHDKQLARELRDLNSNPQRHLPNGALKSPNATALVALKQKWIEQHPKSPAERRLRFESLHDVNRRLRPFVTDRHRGIHAELFKVRQQLRVNAVLERRDYAFCLFPKNVLKEFCRQFLQDT